MGLVFFLGVKRSISVEDLALHFGVSRRTMFRDFEILRQVGFAYTYHKRSGSFTRDQRVFKKFVSTLSQPYPPRPKPDRNVRSLPVGQDGTTQHCASLALGS